MRSLINNYLSIASVPRTERTKRGALIASLDTFRRVNVDIISLDHSKFEKALKSGKIQLLSTQEQNNWREDKNKKLKTIIQIEALPGSSGEAQNLH